METTIWICIAVTSVMGIIIVILEATARIELKKHVHVWTSRTKGHGSPPKQNVPEQIGIRGWLAKCDCGVRMFIPEDPKLAITEVEHEN